MARGVKLLSTGGTAKAPGANKSAKDSAAKGKGGAAAAGAGDEEA